MIFKPALQIMTNGHDAGPHCPGDATRPPKAVREALFVEVCDGCGDCIQSCETGVLARDSKRRPVLDFRQAECTFCGACARVCPVPAFDLAQSRDWTVTARIGVGCMNGSDIVCCLCLKACEQAAVRFSSHAGGGFAPFVVDEMCNGCGACVSVCPARVIAAKAAF